MRSSFALGDLLTSAFRNKLLILLTTVAGGVAMYLYAANLPDRYSGQATLISEAGLSSIIALDGFDAPRIIDPLATTSIVDTIGTPLVISRAIDALSPNLLARLEVEAGIENAPAQAADPADPDALRKSLILRFLSRNLEVNNSGRSYVVSVRYNSVDPELAAAVANAVVEGYLLHREALKNDVYTQMLGALGSEIDGLKNELLAAERTAQTMREQVELLSSTPRTLAERQQEEAIAESAELYAQQREAEREAEATAAVYERLLSRHREIQSRIGSPEVAVHVFSPAIIPLEPSGFNVKPLLLALGVVAGLLVGLSLGLLGDAWRSRRAAGQ
jgi:uncharacterized protein involved in exopolysaccharide biosynthesis